MKTADRIARVELYIPGKAVPKGRPRAGIGKNSGKPFMFTPKKTRDFEEVLRSKGHRLRKSLGWDSPHLGPVAMSFYFMAQKPGNWYPGKEPMVGDLDNYIKAIKDGLKGTVYKDDRQVCRYRDSRKLFWDYPGTLVIMEFYPLIEKPRKRIGRPRFEKS